MKWFPCLALLVGLLSSAGLRAGVFHGVNFPDGEISFADMVVSYDPVIKSGQPNEPYRDPAEALGAPDYTEGAGHDYVSLGDGGSITLRFTNNSLTGSGDSALDLWIFEIGPEVEDTFVEISADGFLWHSVGAVDGATSGIDIDFYGFGRTNFFSFIKLTDDPTKDGQTGATVGADIDAVGAISSAAPVNVPDSGATFALLGLAMAGLLAFRRR